MNSAPLPANESERLRQLHALKLTDVHSEPGFARAARLAKALAKTQRATVAIIEGDRVWLNAPAGEAPEEIAREQALCPHALLDSEVFWVEDARKDRRFAGNPHVASGDRIRFFAAAPINLPGGIRPGAVCVSDSRPRPFDPELASELADIAAGLAEELELRRTRQALGEALAQSEAATALMGVVTRHAPMAVALTDRLLRYVKVSPRWLSDYGFSDEAEVIGRSTYEVMPGTVQHASVHQRVLQGEVVGGDSVAILGPDGRTRHRRWEIAPWFEADGEIGGLVLMTCDITALVESREAVEDSQRRLRMALEIANMVVWELCFADRSVTWDGSAEGLFDQHLDYDALTDPHGSQIHPEDRSRVAEAWRRHEEGLDPVFRCEYRANRPDGKLVWISSIRELVRDEQGRPERIIGVMKDITAQKLHEEAIAHARQAAEDANRAKSEFLANMSHEIRTPLNGVMGVAGALARTELSGPQQEMVRLIEGSAHTLESLLTDVLDIARIEAGGMELHNEPFDLGETVEGVAALFGPKARDKGIAFEHVIDAYARGRFIGDLGRLKQILSNLLSNAVKFTACGHVKLNVRDLGAAEDGAARLQFSVEDTGIGFDDATKARLFERFQQADGSITRCYGGSGLGLSISKNLAGLMGGTLQAHSAPGQGSVFTLTIQLQRAAAVEASLRPASAPVTLTAGAERAPRVLLAEDHPTNRRVVQLILESAGVELVCVENGEEAVAASLQPFDAILMDVQMPVMDGYSAIRAIRARERGSGAAPVPIVALTANAMPEHARASLEAGADLHVTKPLSAQVLLATMARVVSGDLAATEPRAAAAG